MGKTTTVCGLEFEFNSTLQGWRAPRQFAHLPSAASTEVSIESPSSEEPSAPQIRALEGFLENEQAVCESMLDATLRWCRYEHIQDDKIKRFYWPEEDPPASLDDLVVFHTLLVRTLEHDGVALIGFMLSCEWDEEHGLGVLTHNGITLDIGQELDVYSQAFYGLPNAICTKEELAAKSDVVGAFVSDVSPIMINPFTKQPMKNPFLNE